MSESPSEPVDQDQDTGRARASMIERMTRIVAVFDRPGMSLAGGAIAARAGLPRSTTHRIVDEMMRWGWLQRAADGYVLGAGVQAAREPSDRFRLRVAAAPLLRALHNETGLVVHLIVPDGAHVVILDKICGRTSAAGPTQVGSRLPTYATAAGKALLAGMAPEEVDRLLPERLGKRTTWTTKSRDELHFELHRVRQRRGIAVASQEALVGVNCVAAAFAYGEEYRAAIALSAPANAHRLERFGPLLLESARRIQDRLWHGEERQARRAQRETSRPVPDALMLGLLNSIQGDDWI